MSITFTEPFAATDSSDAIQCSVPTREAAAITFGRFLVSPACRTLKLDGEDVCIGARAYDLLVLLLESSGKVVNKDLIMRHVWPATTVDECNLRFQITSLRKALGEERVRIKTITGRGYLFIAETVRILPAASASENGWASEDGTSLVDKPAIFIIDKDPENRVALQRLLRPFAAEIRSYPSIQALRECGLNGRRP